MATVHVNSSQKLLTFQLFYQFCGSREQCTDPQISLLSNFFIKIGSHITIHTFKNYFATVFQFSVFSFSKISSIQTDPKLRIINNTFIKKKSLLTRFISILVLILFIIRLLFIKVFINF